MFLNVKTPQNSTETMLSKHLRSKTCSEDTKRSKPQFDAYAMNSLSTKSRTTRSRSAMYRQPQATHGLVAPHSQWKHSKSASNIIKSIVIGANVGAGVGVGTEHKAPAQNEMRLDVKIDELLDE